MAPASSRNHDEPDPLWSTLIEFVISTKGWWIAICTEMDLTPTQGHALRSLDPDQPVPMSSLAETMFCDASNVTGIVDKLESRGLIARQSADHDRRVKQLVVTEKGRKVRDRLIGRMLEPPAACTAVPAELKTRICGVLRALLAERGR